MTNIAVFLSGSGTNFHALLDNIKENKLKGVTIKLVVSDKPYCQGIQIAKTNDIPYYFIAPTRKSTPPQLNEAEIITLLIEQDIQLVVLAGYMRLLSNSFVRAFYQKIINIHPSLLPSFAGLNAPKQAFNKGVKVSGCTVHFVDEGIDTGPIILQKVVFLTGHESPDGIHKKIQEQEYLALSEAIQLFSDQKLLVKDTRVLILD